MPVIVIEGTKGLADELARASRSNDEDAPTTPVQALAVEAELIVIPLDSDPSDVERLLTRHLKVDETLRDAWAQQELVSEAATEHQVQFGRLQGVILTLGLMVTFLVVAQTVLDDAGYLDRFCVAWNSLRTCRSSSSPSSSSSSSGRAAGSGRERAGSFFVALPRRSSVRSSGTGRARGSTAAPTPASPRVRRSSQRRSARPSGA